MRLLLLARHGRSVFNVDGVVNGAPELDRGLAPEGYREAERLAGQVAAIRVDLCVTSRFLRARETAETALAGRVVPRLVDGDLDDIRIGSLEAKTLEAYREWKDGRSRDVPFPDGGESLNDAARRYADAYERLLAREEEQILCVCHEIPVRYAINAAAGSPEFDAPTHDVANAAPYLFDADGLRRAVERIRELAAPVGRGR